MPHVGSCSDPTELTQQSVASAEGKLRQPDPNSGCVRLVELLKAKISCGKCHQLKRSVQGCDITAAYLDDIVESTELGLVIGQSMLSIVVGQAVVEGPCAKDFEPQTLHTQPHYAGKPKERK